MNHSDAFCVLLLAVGRSTKQISTAEGRSQFTKRLRTGSPQNTSLTKRLSKGVNYPKRRSVGRRPSNKAGQMVLKNTSLTEQLTKGVNYPKTRSAGRRPSNNAVRGRRPHVGHEATSTRRVCLTLAVHLVWR